MRKRTARHTSKELHELDYLSRLSEEDRAWMTQFMYEYYQGDFTSENPIHTTSELRKDCYKRNNSARTQFHSVGSDLISASIAKISRIRKKTSLKSKGYKLHADIYYTMDDYAMPMSANFQETEEDDNDE